MAIQLANKLNTGISPQQFIDGMTKNKEAFLDWYEKFEWNDGETPSFFESLQSRDDLRCLILMADWCGDVVRNIPVVFQVLQKAEIRTEVLIKDQHMDVMRQFLTLGGESIPVVIFTDADGAVLERWGPRPKSVQAVLERFKQDHPDSNAPDYEEQKKAMRAELVSAYGEGTGYQSMIVKELHELLSGL